MNFNLHFPPTTMAEIHRTTPFSSSSSSSSSTITTNTNTNSVRRNLRHESPDSVILNFESNFSSLFSSASASGDRCSFASDAQEPDYELLSQHFVGKGGNGGGGGGGGPDLNHSDSKKSGVSICINNANANARFLCKKVDKVKENKEENNKLVQLHHVDHEIEPLDSARSSFSQPLKECQERRSRSELVNNKSERWRPASLDLNNSSTTTAANVVVGSSPKFGVIKKVSTTTRKSRNFPSPGTPNYRHSSVAMNKGWSSERVPLPSNGSNGRQVGASFLPLSNNNNRGLPSKWEDAERWIFSPVSGDGGGRVSSSSTSYQQPIRRPKSKSGPLGPPGVAYYSMYSPVLPMYEGNHSSSNMAGSPFSAAGTFTDGWSFRVNGESRSFSNDLEPCIGRSASVHGCTDVVCQASQASSQDERVNDSKDAAAIVSLAVSRRDMATQMSPEGSCHSSPRRPFSPSTPSILPIVAVQGLSSSKPEVRDVQIDERVTVTRWSKKYRGCNSAKGSEDVDEWKLKAVQPHSSAWEVSDTVKSLSKARRDEAKISAWENLQKAKAEAAIRKLEMKLEKKRSSSMDKIMKKLRSAQKKAQEMRSSILANQTLQVSKPSNKIMSFRTRQMGSLSGCFTCHAF